MTRADQIAQLRGEVTRAREALGKLLDLAHVTSSGMLVPSVQDFAEPLFVLGNVVHGVEMMADELEAETEGKGEVSP